MLDEARQVAPNPVKHGDLPFSATRLARPLLKRLEPRQCLSCVVLRSLAVRELTTSEIREVLDAERRYSPPLKPQCLGLAQSICRAPGDHSAASHEDLSDTGVLGRVRLSTSPHVLEVLFVAPPMTLSDIEHTPVPIVAEQVNVVAGRTFAGFDDTGVVGIHSATR